ncbi:Similar to pol: Retrovirus-related Pol polyprotein from transposon 17.6 (Drosophila melanogaster) [Cotesia congregata]|uniref:Similar to pol: Retrovirus-related Pol polyprotein from transposon 17.6 (Drosophila melanogaster) n=1 Tax=Cotesia congregata TaxID=51543 RepID=A0A8J2EK37_COTCN|nr:Similar to pol: Retrovirus-related Pol polyprotein from transposon 17.6 (Drosophila melanogaster) [Cotesia congregata]
MKRSNIHVTEIQEFLFSIFDLLHSFEIQISDFEKPMGKNRRSGYRYHLKKVHSDFINGKINRLSKPITDLTRKTKPFIWTEEVQAAFDDIKNALCEDSFLKYQNFNKPFILAVSASDSEISRILSQATTVEDDDPDGDGEKIVSCVSRVFHDTETRYIDVEKQCLAVVYAIQQFRPYLQKHFTLITSSPCVTWLRDSATVTERQAKWRSQLNRYKFNVVVRHKITEQYAERLSYNPEGRSEPLGNPINNNTENESEENESDKNTLTPRNVNRSRFTGYLGDGPEPRTPIFGRVLIPDELAAMGIRYDHASRQIVDENSKGINEMAETESADPNNTPIESERGRSSENSSNIIRSTSPRDNNENKSHDSSGKSSDSDKNKDRPTTSGNATVGDDAGNRRFGPPFVAYDPPTFEEAEDIFAERRHRSRISSPSSSDERISPKGPEIKIKFSISREGLTYARDHLVHFLAADCKIIKPVVKLLRDLKFINADDLHASKPTKGDVFVTKLGRCKIFTVFIKTNHFKKLDPIDLIERLRNLRQSMHKHDIHSLRCAKQGDEFDDLDIQAYLLHDTPRKIQPTNPHQAPWFSFVGTIARKLFGTMDYSDKEHITKEIDKLYQDNRELVHLSQNNTHIIRSEINEILKHENQGSGSNISLPQASSKQTTERPSEKPIILDGQPPKNSQQRRKTIEEAKWGKLTYLTVSAKQLHKATTSAVADMMKKHPTLNPPQPLDHMDINSLARVSTVEKGKTNGHFLIIITMPLFDQMPWLAYELKSLPKPEEIGDQISTLTIQPTSK